MATGSGKTFTAVNFIYRLVKYGGARRVLFLVDRGNLGDQTLKEFQQFVSPVNNYKFTEEYIVQRLSSNNLDKSARVVIGTIQRVYSMLKGEKEPAPDLDDLPIESAESLFKPPVPVEYNPDFPIEEFDFIITDECHRSIYNLWRQVLEYFDASLIGLTATPSKQTFGFFQQNLVMEWKEVDLDKAEWRIPAERMKMRDPHIVPLSVQAVVVLREFQSLTGQWLYVFPNQQKTSGFMSENTMLYGLYRIGYHTRATGHGFRATASTILNEYGFEPSVIERQRAHAERNGVRAAYNHAEYLPERRKMMQWWADYLDKAAAKK